MLFRSSRGPIRSAGSNILKPDIMAPGVDVLAAVSPVAYGRNFDFYSGTSMAAPHMTGIAALMRQAHPGWSASAIKSALMTTASTRDNAGQPIDGGPFDFGAGQVVPTSALDPGLVYESGWSSWLAFLCGSEPGVVGTSTCDILASRGYSFDPSELNYPSIAVSSLAGVKTIHRTVTNVTKAAETYTINANVPGFDVSVAGDATFTIQPGKTQAIALTFTRTTAALNEWATGSLVLTGDRGHVVNSPIVAPSVAGSSAMGITARVGFGEGWVTTVAYSEGVTQLDLSRDLKLANPDPLHSEAYGIGFAKQGLFGDDALGIAISRPLQVYSGANLGAMASSFALSNMPARESDVAFGYVTTFLDGALALQANEIGRAHV